MMGVDVLIVTSVDKEHKGRILFHDPQISKLLLFYYKTNIYYGKDYTTWLGHAELRKTNKF